MRLHPRTHPRCTCIVLAEPICLYMKSLHILVPVSGFLPALPLPSPRGEVKHWALEPTVLITDEQCLAVTAAVQLSVAAVRPHWNHHRFHKHNRIVDVDAFFFVIVVTILIVVATSCSSCHNYGRPTRQHVSSMWSLSLTFHDHYCQWITIIIITTTTMQYSSLYLQIKTYWSFVHWIQILASLEFAAKCSWA